jgi:hypothetical protein
MTTAQATVRALGRGLTLAISTLALVGMWSWCVLAIYFSNLPGATLRTVAAWTFGLGLFLLFVALPKRRRTALWFVLAFGGVLIWWLLIPPSQDRNWKPELAVIPRAEISGELVTVYNIRNFDDKTPDDFTIRYYDKTFDLNNIETVDFAKSHWDDIQDVAHTLLSFGFRGGSTWHFRWRPASSAGGHKRDWVDSSSNMSLSTSSATNGIFFTCEQIFAARKSTSTPQSSLQNRRESSFSTSSRKSINSTTSRSSTTSSQGTARRA